MDPIDSLVLHENEHEASLHFSIRSQSAERRPTSEDQKMEETDVAALSINKNHSTRDSQVVPHLGTNRAALCLTAQIGRDAVFSESYGRGWLEGAKCAYEGATPGRCDWRSSRLEPV